MKTISTKIEKLRQTQKKNGGTPQQQNGGRPQ
jgi:hypothetical protein